MDISVIIPLSANKFRKDLDKRASEAERFFRKLDIPVYTEKSPFGEKRVNIAYLRQKALSHIKTGSVIFWDADLQITEHQFLAAVKLFKESENNFVQIPSLYLSRYATLRMNGYFNYDYGEYIKYVLEGNKFFVNHIAFNTSTILCKTSHVLKLGGFDCNYSGHGYEDFDLLLRLYRYEKVIPHDDCWIAPQRQFSPLFFQGILKHISWQAVDFFLKDIFSVHCNHKIDKRVYNHSRSINFEHFIKKNKLIDHNQSSEHEDIVYNFNKILSSLKNNNKCPFKYSFLFSNMQSKFFLERNYTRRTFKLLIAEFYFYFKRFFRRV